MALEVEVRFATAEARHAFAEELAQQVARLAASPRPVGAGSGSSAGCIR
jgi:hypothetical protein